MALKGNEAPCHQGDRAGGSHGSGLCYGLVIAVFVTAVGQHAVTQGREGASVIGQHLHRLRLDDLVDCFGSAANRQCYRVVIVHAFGVEHAIGGCDAPTQRPEVVMRCQRFAEQITEVPRVTMAGDTEIAHDHLIANRARPRPADVGTNKTGRTRCSLRSHRHRLGRELRQSVDRVVSQHAEGAASVVADTQIRINVLVDRPLQRRQQHRCIQFARPKDMDPALTFKLPFVAHDQDAATHLIEVVAQHSRDSPPVEVKHLHCIVPRIGLSRLVTLQHVQQAGVGVLAIGIEELEVVEGLRP